MRTLTAVLLLIVLPAPAAVAQDLEPRAYSPSPVGTTFLIATATRSSGGVFTDPSAPITDVEATVGILGIGVGHTFAIGSKQALVLGALPITWGEASGQVGEGRHEVSRRGLADLRVRLSVILRGSPALTAAEFARAPRRVILGASLTVVAPTGQYEPTKLVNLGSHRWSFKPEAGMSVPAGRWTFDSYAAVWLFTDNDRYYPGMSLRSQDPILALQGHVSYTLGRRTWLAINGTWYSGGQTRIGETANADLQRNTRLGATWSQLITARQSLKFAYSTGAITRVGADFRTITAAWQIVFF